MGMSLRAAHENACDIQVCIALMTQHMRGAENVSRWQNVGIVERCS